MLRRSWWQLPGKLQGFPNSTSTNNTLASEMLLHLGPCLCCSLVLTLSGFLWTGFDRASHCGRHLCYQRKLSASEVSLVARGRISLTLLLQRHSYGRTMMEGSHFYLNIFVFCTTQQRNTKHSRNHAYVDFQFHRGCFHLLNPTFWFHALNSSKSLV